jgi:hypothetical protein
MKRLHKKVNRKSLLSSDSGTSAKYGKCCGHAAHFSMGIFESMTFFK